MLPLTVGMLISGPTSGILSDRYGARPFATGGMVATAISFCDAVACCRSTSPTRLFALGAVSSVGLSFGLFASPNRAAVMNSLPPADRGAGGAMNQTLQNSAQVLSVGIFFSLMIAGLASSLPRTLTSGLAAHGVPLHVAQAVGHVPPVSVLFSAFLGYNPVKSLVGKHVLSQLSVHNRTVLTGHAFFPHLISAPFSSGLHSAFTFAIIACLIAGVASALRGGVFRHGDPPDHWSPRRSPRGAAVRRLLYRCALNMRPQFAAAFRANNGAFAGGIRVGQSPPC